MKAAVFYKKDFIKVEDVPDPVPGEGEILVKVKACGVCGTDMHIYHGAEGATDVTPGTILGHEFSGIVADTGPGVMNTQKGDRVSVDPNISCGKCYYCREGKIHFCKNLTAIGVNINGGFAEYCKVPEKQAYIIPGHLSFEEGALAEPAACCIHGIDLAAPRPGDTVMIIGGGTIGLIMVQLAKASGASRLILLEPVGKKRELAGKLGADLVINPLEEDVTSALKLNNIQHIDIVMECAGLKKTMEDAINYTGKGGTAVLFGLTGPDCSIPLYPFEIFRKEITVKGSFINPLTQRRAVSMLESGRLKVNNLITDAAELENINKVFESECYRGRGKIIIKP